MQGKSCLNQPDSLLNDVTSLVKQECRKILHHLSLYSVLIIVFVTKDSEGCRQHKAESGSKCVGEQAKS